MKEKSLKILELVTKQLDKEFGKGSLIRLGDKQVETIESIHTGSIGLDIALGIGGVPRGRIIEIYGPESSGKTTLSLHIIAEMQKMGELCAFIDAEHALDITYAKRLGVDTANIYLSQPSSGEEALVILEQLTRSGAVGLVVIDSVAALTPKNEIEGDMGDTHVGLQARLMSQALRKITGILHKMNTTLIFINQIRMKIGNIGYGSPETTTGGNALKFYASVRIDVRRISQIKVNDQAIGNRTRAKVVKNKLAPPFREAEFDIIFGEGISKIGEIIDYGVKLDIIDKSGAWFSYQDTKIGQGRENAKIYLKEHKHIMDEIEGKIRESIGVVVDSAEEEKADKKERVKKIIEEAAAEAGEEAEEE